MFKVPAEAATVIVSGFFYWPDLLEILQPVPTIEERFQRASAITSISTSAPRGNPRTSTVERAGGPSGKRLP